MRFAEDYYARFPKVAIGHYPPGYYLIEGLWLIPSRTKAAVLLLPAFLTAFAAWIIFMAGRRLMRFAPALSAAVLFTSLHLVRSYTAIVMSDMLLVVLCLLAVLAFARFLSTGRAIWSLAFGVLAAAAILTKGSGLLLALVPPAAILLTGRWRAVLSPKLWLAPLPVVLLAVPWLVATSHITAEGMSAAPPSEYAFQAIPYYALKSLLVLGPVLLLLACVAAVLALRTLKRERKLSPLEAALWGSVGAVFAFYCVIPSGLDERYLLPAIPAVLIVGFAALDRAALALGGKCPPFLSWALVVVVALAATWKAARPVAKIFNGVTPALEEMLRSSGDPLNLVVCSDSKGEGALVAAAALMAPERVVVQRGTKLLSTSDWLGRGYEMSFSTDEELFELLENAGITHVIVDDGTPEAQVWQHQKAVSAAMRGHPERFTQVRKAPVERRDQLSHLTIANFLH
ncbi:glycosyltransferase family 39 protein [Luteolibacter sp. SL250]|uniref:ArnT family glycosyltransferase n=1 Tax=Luteolibacter sp. SL250 TaxID=2995170 RepID=UPI00226E0DBC|nr:glycosyltransferase family 39 protein [Luteolibacter sp. SL250]WAC19631.1 glycosyltransferase family 39 protein [Luteolibacter sp. SL250]